MNSDLRVYLRPGVYTGVVTGGKVNSVCAGIRQSAAKTRLALHFCELMYRMTPEFQSNAEKFYLLAAALEFLDLREILPSVRAAFTFRLMRLAGFGLAEPVLGIPAGFWRRLHDEPFETLDFNTPEEKEFLLKSEYVISRFITKTFPQGIRTAETFENPRDAANLSL